MDPTEYLAIIPLLIFGIALTDLLSQWKRVFNKEDRHVLYIIFTILLTEVAINNVVKYVDLINTYPHQTYFEYLLSLVPPVAFMILVNVFTPDEGTVTKEYFEENTPLIFGLVAVFVGLHFLFKFDEPPHTIYMRLVFIALLIGIAITRKKWLMYVVIALWLIGLILRGQTMAA